MRQTLFGWLARLIFQRRAWIIGITLALFLLLLFPLRLVRFSTDVLELIPQELDVLQTFRDLETHFVQGGDLVLVVENSRNDPAALESFQRLLVDELHRIPDIEEVTPLLGGGINPSAWRWLWERFWLALTPLEMDAFIDKLQPERIRDAMHRNRVRLESAPSGLVSQQITYDPLGVSEILIGHVKAIFGGKTPQPGNGAFQILNLVARGGLNDSHRCMRLVDEVRAAEHRARQAFAGSGEDPSQFQIGHTGRVAFTAEIASKMRRNMLATAVSSLALVVFLFWLGFRSRIPLLAIAATLLIAVVATISLSGMIFGGFNVITGSFAAILIGIGVDYGILIYNRYSTAVDAGVPREEAIRHTVSVTVPGITLGAITTATAFLSIASTASPGFRQFGMVVPIGIVLCAVLMIGFYFSLISGRSRPAMASDVFKRTLRSLSEWILRRRRAAFAASAMAMVAALAIVLGGSRPGVGFDANPNSLRFRHSAAFDTLEKLFTKLQRAANPCVLLVSATDWNTAAERTEQLAARLTSAQSNGWVQSFESISALFPSPTHQARNARRLAALDWPAIREALRAAVAAEGFRVEEFQTAFAWLETAQKGADAPSAALLAPTPAMMDNADTAVLLKHFVYLGPHQFQTATYVYPTHPLDSVAAIDALKKKLGLDDPTVRLTSWDALIVEMQPLFRRDFIRVSVFVFLAVVVIVFLFYRRIGLTLLALLPLGGALLCLLAIMKLAGIKFNLANFFAVPIVIGAGVDYSIYVINAFLERDSDCASVVSITGKAVVLSALTTIIGFGSLVLTDHMGLATFGLLTATGIFLCLVFSLITLPVCMAKR